MLSLAYSYWFSPDGVAADLSPSWRVPPWRDHARSTPRAAIISELFKKRNGRRRRYDRENPWKSTVNAPREATNSTPHKYRMHGINPCDDLAPHTPGYITFVARSHIVGVLLGYLPHNSLSPHLSRITLSKTSKITRPDPNTKIRKHPWKSSISAQLF